MTEEILADAILREFLLGKVDDETRERIESLFLTDSKVRERILAAEQDLIEDYLEDSLTAVDRDIFLSRYGQTPEQHRQLLINKSIKAWAQRESRSTDTIPVKTSPFSQLRERLRLRPVLLIPIAVTAIIALVFIAIWLNSRREQQNSSVATEQELIHLNTPASLREVPPQMTLLDLSPVTLRSGGEQETELKKSADIRLVELRLPWTHTERYPTYHVEIRRLDGGETFAIPDVQSEVDKVDAVRVRLPARLLRRGHYKVRLSGITPDGNTGSTQEYMFVVSD